MQTPFRLFFTFSNINKHKNKTCADGFKGSNIKSVSKSFVLLFKVKINLMNEYDVPVTGNKLCILDDTTVVILRDMFEQKKRRIVVLEQKRNI